MGLTDRDFWDKYWDGIKLPSTVNMKNSFDRCLGDVLKRELSVVKGELFEVGCAPGKWLAYLAKECDLLPNGIEYSEEGMNATRKNLRLLDVPAGKIIYGDFFKEKPVQQFDVVMSLGFIEHFENVHEVIELHLQWLKPGGLLVIGIPNFSGITGYIQRVLDKTLLDKHNLTIMNLKYFNDLAGKHSLDKRYTGYIGSFEPNMPIPKYKYGNPLQFLLKCFLRVFVMVRRYKLFDAINSPFTSSYILAVYRKKGDCFG